MIFIHYKSSSALPYIHSEERTHLEAVTTAAKAARTNGDNWVAGGAGLSTSTQSRSEESTLRRRRFASARRSGREENTYTSGVGHICSADSNSRVARLKGACNSGASENGDSREDREELSAEHDDCD